MRGKPLLYLETSVFGFYFEHDARNQVRREAVMVLLKQIHEGRFRAITSPVTTRELAQAAEPLASHLLDLLVDIEEFRADRTEVEWLAGQYLAEGGIPRKYEDDARHVAYATLARSEILVSLNLKHIANEWVERKINAINLRNGYPQVRIRTPEEVIIYEE